MKCVAARSVCKFKARPWWDVFARVEAVSRSRHPISAWTFREELTMGDMLDAVVYYGDVPDSVVRADTTELERKYGAEFERRARLTNEAANLLRLRR